MSASAARLKFVYIALMVVTVASLALTTDALHTALSYRGAAALAAVIAFIKARYVVLEFMELRGTSMQLPFDIWLLVVAAGGMALALR